MIQTTPLTERLNLPSTLAGLEKKGYTTSPLDDRINILLVDDNPDKLVSLEVVLSDLKQNLVKAKSGPEALKLLLKQDFAVILLDVNMPGMDGFETAYLIRQRAASAHTPIIFITSISTGDSEVYKGYSLGAVDYIFTPVVPEVLRAKVSVFIELYKKSEQIRFQSELLRKAEEEKLQRKLNETVERLEDETNRNRFFTLSIEMLAIANFDGYFCQLNPTWQNILGFTEEQLKAKPYLEYIHADHRKSIQEVISSLKMNGSSIYFETRFECRDGAFKWLGLTITPFASEGLLYCFARDISERRQREEQIQKLNESLKQQSEQLKLANQELESYSYSISHDLRAPLRAITGYSQILLMECMDGLNEDGRRMLQSICRSGMHMSQLIDDFLEFCRLGRFQLKFTILDFKELAEKVIESLRPNISNRTIEFKIMEMPPTYGDPSMLRQLLFNLIANSIKFTSKQKSTVIEIGATGKGKDTIYYVRDNGVGFDMKYYDKLFGVFQRLHKAEDFEGTGVGLAIVQRIVQRHGGKIWAEAKLNKGATFYFTLSQPVEI